MVWISQSSMRRYPGSIERWVKMLQAASKMVFQSYLHEITENGPFQTKREPDYVCFLKRTLLGLEEVQDTWLTIAAISLPTAWRPSSLSPGPLLPFPSFFPQYNPDVSVIFSLGPLDSLPLSLSVSFHGLVESAGQVRSALSSPPLGTLLGASGYSFPHIHRKTFSSAIPCSYHILIIFQT